MLRKLLMLGLAAYVGLLAWTAFAQEDRTNPPPPNIIGRYLAAGQNFIRQPDTTCACFSDTTEGPSAYVFGAKYAILRLQANSGTCSTITAQVSNNDTNWVNVSTLNQLGTLQDFTVGDSLNRGGVTVTIFAEDAVPSGHATSVIPYRYARLLVRQRAGVTSNNDCTALCRAKVDSLRFKLYIHTTGSWGQ